MARCCSLCGLFLSSTSFNLHLSLSSSSWPAVIRTQFDDYCVTDKHQSRKLVDQFKFASVGVMLVTRWINERGEFLARSIPRLEPLFLSLKRLISAYIVGRRWHNLAPHFLKCDIPPMNTFGPLFFKEIFLHLCSIKLWIIIMRICILMIITMIYNWRLRIKLYPCELYGF